MKRCSHRGQQIRTVNSAICSTRGIPIAVFACNLKGECTRKPTGRYHPWIQDCERCQFNDSGLSKDDNAGPSIGVSCDESK
jgi:hypothetical protein